MSQQELIRIALTAFLTFGFAYAVWSTIQLDRTHREQRERLETLAEKLNQIKPEESVDTYNQSPQPTPLEKELKKLL
jgi:hypothetical protein